MRAGLLLLVWSFTFLRDPSEMDFGQVGAHTIAVKLYNSLKILHQRPQPPPPLGPQ